MDKEALAAYLESWGLTPDRLASIRKVYAKAGLREYWRHELTAEVAKGSKPDNPCWMATIYMHLGDKERALEYLNRGFQQHCSGLHVLKVDPLYDSLRDDPRFKELIARLRLWQFRSSTAFNRSSEVPRFETTGLSGVRGMANSGG